MEWFHFIITLVISVLFVVVKVLMAIPFLTLLERKVLSYMQNRKGPNKVSFLGLLQPIGDGVKLVLKSLAFPFKSNKIMFFLLPLMSFLFMVLCWILYPFYFKNFSLSYTVVLVLCISSLAVYIVLFSGWASNSKYASLGSLRGAAQSMSYEVSLILMLLTPCSLNFSLNLVGFKSSYFLYGLMFPLLFFMWFMNCLAESNRAPFDFAEGESELVSGFKVEYSSLNFAFLFLGEYGMMLFLSFLTSLVFFSLLKFFFIIILGSLLTFSFVWVRASLPRFRYDLLMVLAWKVFLPLSMFFLCWVLMLV